MNRAAGRLRPLFHFNKPFLHETDYCFFSLTHSFPEESTQSEIITLLVSEKGSVLISVTKMKGECPYSNKIWNVPL